MNSTPFEQGLLKKKPVLAIFIALFVDFVAFGMMVPVLPAFFGPDDSTLFGPEVGPDQRTVFYSLILGLFGLCTFLGAPLLGALSDRLGRKRVLLLTNLANALGHGLLGFGILQQNIVWVFVGRIISGLFGGSIFIIQSALADVSDADTKTKNFGMVGVAFGLGFILGAIGGGVLANPEYASWFGSVTPFGAAMVLNLANLAIITVLLPETLFERNLTSKVHAFSGFKNLYTAFSDKHLRLLYSVIFILTVGFAFFLQFLPLFLDVKFDFDKLEVGIMFAFIGIWAAITQGLFLRWTSKLLLPIQVLLYFTPFFGISYLLLLLPTTGWLLYVLIPIMVIFQSITFPNTLTILSDEADRRSQGQYLSINQSLHSFGAALAAFAGIIATLDYGLIMGFGAACTGLAYAIFLVYYRRKQRFRKLALSGAEMVPVQTEGDLESIRELLSNAGLPFADVGKESQEFFLFRFNKKDFGTIGMEALGQTGLLRSLSVAREFRKNKLGRKLVSRLLGHCKEKGVRELFLITENARGYFRELGFQEVERNQVPEFIGGFLPMCDESASVMHLRLEG